MKVATETRYSNLCRVIAELQQGELTQDEISKSLKCSRSGVRSYLKALGVLVEAISHGSTVVARTYRITSEQAALDAFLSATPKKRIRKSRSNIAADVLGPSRRVHILADDMRFHVKLLRKIPQHTELHARFFGGVT